MIDDFPALKRGANNHCAYGAERLRACWVREVTSSYRFGRSHKAIEGPLSILRHQQS
jgi:hypothetical protein